MWTENARAAFKQLKHCLMSAPALGLPDLTKPFELFTHEQLNVALGVLAQHLGDQRRAVAYFSKQLDNVAQGWPGCLKAVAATVLLIQEARKFTLGQHIVVYVPHAVINVLEQKEGHWLSPSRMLKYQSVLLEQDDVTLKTTSVVNPAMFLSSTLLDSVPEHDCLQSIEETYPSRPDLEDVSLKDPDWELYTNGSSFKKNDRRMTGYAVTTSDKIIEAKALPPNVSSQKAELIALMRALELSEEKKVNIWTDSKYAFSVVHAHGAIWKERGLLTAQEAPEIHRVLQTNRIGHSCSSVPAWRLGLHQVLGQRPLASQVEGTIPSFADHFYCSQGCWQGTVDSLFQGEESFCSRNYQEDRDRYKSERCSLNCYLHVCYLPNW
ncbi:uncharacterized protein LOC125319005 [Corvus hawaiiensis]|uniref:uncharacterized protein LOC125319005 n=1 Tax=Corvus hawaiiensis TaxID=134902 RepID=UPI002019FC52|nr:uncharacterized protein LOC125319005 [Corvus hawaiiensis]